MFCTICALIFLISLPVGFLIWTRNYRFWESQNVPAIPAKFPCGNFWQAFTLEVPLYQIIAEAYDRFPESPLVGMYGPTQPVLLVKDLDLAKQVLVDKFNDFSDPGFEVSPSVDPLLGHNPFAAKGADWKEARNIHTPAFTNSKVKAAMPEITSSALKLIDHIKHEKSNSINILFPAKMFLTDAVTKSAYGIDSKVWEDPEPLIRHMIKMGPITDPFEFNFASVCAVLLPWVNRITRFKFLSTKSHDLMKRIYRSVIPMRKAESGTNRNDSLQHLIDLEKKRILNGMKGMSSGFTDTQWAVHLMVFFFDGTETAGIALSYVVFLISKNLDVQRRLREEIVNRGITLENLDFETIRSLEFMEMVLQECLRKLPPLPILTRKANKETSLGDVRVPKGTKIVVPAMKLQNDPKYYQNPDGFDPERFSSERRSEVKKGTYFPFGEGPRICIGMKYAKTAIKVALAALLLEFNWTPGPFHEGDLDFDRSSTFFLAPKNFILDIKFSAIH